MNTKITQEIKDQIVDNEKPVYASLKGERLEGFISGRKLEFPVFHSGRLHYEISWNLAYRASFKDTVIVI